MSDYVNGSSDSVLPWTHRPHGDYWTHPIVPDYPQYDYPQPTLTCRTWLTWATPDPKPVKLTDEQVRALKDAAKDNEALRDVLSRVWPYVDVEVLP